MAQSPNLSGKVCLITGATQGIGRITARELAKLGPTMVLVVRDEQRGRELAAELHAAGNPHAEILVADLSSQAEVRRVAAEFLARHDRLDLLINNAGALFMERKESVDGLEMTFALNHLGYFLLTNLLIDVLKKSAPARIVSVASRAHGRGTISFDDLQSKRGYSGWSAYSQSKLANILFSNELARRLAGSGVTSNCLHPGVVATGFGKNNSGLMGFLVKLGAPFLRTPEKGAATTVFLAQSPEVEGVTGEYFADCKSIQPSLEARDQLVAKRLWQVSEQLTGLGKDS
ncbi:MAG: SDR family oxidoreductase [Deltaproteobacteria bacterium]|nr:SDR family oxidoreductase [Deltaproteobacteria bacterium]